MSDGNRSEGPVLRLSSYKKGYFADLESSPSLSLKGQLSSFPFPLSHSLTANIGLDSGAFGHGWRCEWIFPLPFPLSVSTSQHKGIQIIHSAVTLSLGDTLILLAQNKMTLWPI
jgi:hypothetical protein